MDWHFAPIAFDTLGACSDSTMTIMESLARKIAHHSHCSYENVKMRLQQHTSYGIGSSIATAILARMPSHIADTHYPVQV